MKITVMGALIVLGGIVLVGLIVFAAGQRTHETENKANEQPINPS
jgi:hypothetical protein